ncbi:MAG: MCE family protein [Myxococcales bacterium]|nr:MAG: MCE family protein [Myxococcales bacterium]
MRRKPARKLVISALSVFLVFVLCVAYLVSNVLDTPLTKRPTRVDVHLSTTGGLFEGAVVTYRGVKVGKVSKISFADEGVVAALRITGDDDIPKSSRAVVRSLSPVGEQYVDLQPKDTKGPYLESGDTISGASTSVPRTLASTVISVNKLLKQIDRKDLATVLDETSVALSGTGADLARLADHGELLVNDLNRLWPETERLLTNSDTLLDIGIDNKARLVQTARDFKLVAAFLKSMDGELRRALNDGPGQIRTLDGLLKDAEDLAPTFLRLGSDVTYLLASYEPHLRSLLKDFAPGLGVLSAAIRDGRLMLDAIFQKDHVCDYGTAEINPKSTTRREMVKDKGCSGDYRWLQRGAAHAPGPIR